MHERDNQKKEENLRENYWKKEEEELNILVLDADNLKFDENLISVIRDKYFKN